MIGLPAGTRVWIAAGVTDMRKGMDGLAAIVQTALGERPFSGDVFVFHNGARDRVKLLVWDRNGFWLLYKRLEKGTFPFGVAGEGVRVEIDRAQLAMLLDGIEWKSAKRSSRFASVFVITGRDGTARRSPR